MVTNNFIQIMKKVLLTMNNGNTGYIPVVDRGGNNRYMIFGINNTFPASVNNNYADSATSYGIRVGSGNRAESSSDYELQSQITSGLSGSVASNCGVDNDNNPYVDFVVTLTNTSNSEITIREIGYSQQARVSTSYGSTSLQNTMLLLDRTVLDNEVTIAPNDFAVIDYKLRTIEPSN